MGISSWWGSFRAQLRARSPWVKSASCPQRPQLVPRGEGGDSHPTAHPLAPARPPPPRRLRQTGRWALSPPRRGPLAGEGMLPGREAPAEGQPWPRCSSVTQSTSPARRWLYIARRDVCAGNVRAVGLGGRRRLGRAAPATAAKVTKCWMGKRVPGDEAARAWQPKVPPRQEASTRPSCKVHPRRAETPLALAWHPGGATQHPAPSGRTCPRSPGCHRSGANPWGGPCRAGSRAVLSQCWYASDPVTAAGTRRR